MKEIDINCDVGEGIGNDAAIMPYVSSCNIACGAHAGDANTMRETIALAKEHGVKIGAHPSYPDRENFGRKVMQISTVELINSIEDQLNQFETIAQPFGVLINHIKPHGALYNEVVRNEKVADAVIKAIRKTSNSLMLYAPYKSKIAELANANGLTVRYEGFADRAYEDNLELVSRSDKGAVFQDEKEIFGHVLRMIKNSQVMCKSGNLRQIQVDTICVHGDNPNAVEIVKYLNQNLVSEGINLI